MRIILKTIKWLLILFFGSTVLTTAVYRFVPVYITPLMIIRAINPQGSEKQCERERNWRHHWVAYDDISPWMPRAVIASEDGNFYSHNGFDFKAIQQAIKEKCALLAVSLPSPLKRDPANPSAYLSRRASKISSFM